MTVTDLRNSFHPCPKPLQKKKEVCKNIKRTAEMKKKSKKLTKLERQRDKDLIKTGICECCERYSERLDPHEVYGGSNRKRSIKYRFVKLICPKCHHNENQIMQLRKNTQKEYEKNHTRAEFIAIVGKSYL